MAKRGRRPKPTRKRLVDGTHRTTRHGAAAKAEKSVAVTASTFGSKPERPPWLTGEARKAWDAFIVPATWIDGARAPSAIAFCTLWSEFRQSPQKFVSARHAQLRAYMAELGLTDERNRNLPDRREDDDDEGFA